MTLLDVFRLTRREYFADFFITPPITFILLCVSLWNATAVWPVGFAAGLFAWTLYEYATHRWVSHALGVFREAHFIHHISPREYIAIHPAVTLALYFSLWAAFGVGSSSAMVGFSTGYIAYSVAHTAFHYWRMPTWLRPAAGRHDAHHKYGIVNYGVTTPLWDHVFGTYRA